MDNNIYLNIGLKRLKEQWYEYKNFSVTIIGNDLSIDNACILFQIKKDIIKKNNIKILKLNRFYKYI